MSKVLITGTSSGIGREKGHEGLEELLEYRAYVIPKALADSMAADGTPVES